MNTPTLMNMLITPGRGRWEVVLSVVEGGLRSQPPLLLEMEPQVGVGVPHVPRVSSSLLAARQSLHTLPLSGNPGCSGSGDGTGEGCPWDQPAHTLRARPHLVTRLHVAGFTSVTHAPWGTWWGGGAQGGSQGSLRHQPQAQCLGHVHPAEARGFRWS